MFGKKKKIKKEDYETNDEQMKRAAGFVVDLKEQLNGNHQKQRFDNSTLKDKAKNWLSNEKNFKMLKIFSFLPRFKKRANKKENLGSVKLKQLKNKESKQKKSAFSFRGRVSDLTIFKIFKFIYKTFYIVGWFTVFFIRFFGILGYRLFKGLAKGIFLARMILSYKAAVKKKIIKLGRYPTVFIGFLTISAGKGRKKVSDFVSRLYNSCKNKVLFSVDFLYLSVFSGIKNAYKFTVGRGFLLFQKYGFLIWNFLNKKIKDSGEKNRAKRLEEKILEKNKALEEIKYHKNAGIKTIAIFAFMAILMILPFKAITYYESLQVNKLKEEVVLSAQAAVENLKEASVSMSSLNMDKARSDFGNANINFSQAEERIARINGVFLDLAKFVPSQDAKMASMSRHLIDAGNLISETGAELTLAFEGVKKANKNEIIKAIDDFEEHGNKAAKNLQELNGVLKKIDSEALPEQYRGKVNVLKKETGNLEGMLTELVGVTEELRILLGAKKDKNYLLVFQNNNEARATGGFIGSYALLEITEGKIDNIEVPAGGSYDVRAGMREFYESPAPLHLVSSLWHFRDANWWPDWPTSAENLMKFYSDSGGPTTDGVISFTPTVLESVLDVTGPISMEEDYGVTFTSENCEETLRNIIEEEAGHVDPAKAQQENKDVTEPKKIIGDLMDKLVKKIGTDFDRYKLIELIGVASDNLKEKQILFYFTDKELQKEIEKRGWGGEVKETDRDYLSVVNTNIAGRKSDKKIKQEIDHKAIIKQDGSIVNEVKIKRHHTGDKNTPYYGERNVNWIRIYVPEGSEFMEAKGFDNRPDDVYFDTPENNWKKHPLVEKQQNSLRSFDNNDKASIYNTGIYGDADKTVIAGWFMLDPGEVKTITLKYKLPFKFIKEKKKEDGFFGKVRQIVDSEQKEFYPYSLYVQKQAGAKPDSSKMESEIVFPDDYSIVWRYPENKENKKSHYKSFLNNDQYWAILLER